MKGGRRADRNALGEDDSEERGEKKVFRCCSPPSPPPPFTLSLSFSKLHLHHRPRNELTSFYSPSLGSSVDRRRARRPARSPIGTGSSLRS
jgi:hypothetical protein